VVFFGNKALKAIINACPIRSRDLGQLIGFQQPVEDGTLRNNITLGALWKLNTGRWEPVGTLMRVDVTPEHHIPMWGDAVYLRPYPLKNRNSRPYVKLEAACRACITASGYVEDLTVNPKLFVALGNIKSFPLLWWFAVSNEAIRDNQPKEALYWYGCISNTLPSVVVIKKNRKTTYLEKYFNGANRVPVFMMLMRSRVGRIFLPPLWPKGLPVQMGYFVRREREKLGSFYQLKIYDGIRHQKQIPRRKLPYHAFAF